jgi:cytochrome c oxidase assembly factor CtaG/putative copper export protein
VSQAPVRHLRSSLRAWVVVVGVVAVGAVAMLALAVGTEPYRAVGNADPGAVVSVGAPVLRLLADLAAVSCLGSLAFAVFCTRPRPSGVVSADGYSELLIASVSAWLWCATALVQVPFSAADTAGLPIRTVLAPGPLSGLVSALETPKAWLITAVLAAGVALGCRAALRWVSAVALLVAAVFAVLPPLVTAHGSSDVGHDVALGAIVIHVPTAVLWVGLLLAVLRHVRRGGRAPGEILARYSKAANGCWIVLVCTGIVLAGVLVPASAVLASGYGLAVLVKTVLVALLGAGGIGLRRRTYRQVARAASGSGRMIRCGLAELVMLVSVLVLSVDLTHLALPDFFGHATTTGQTLLGYDLSGPPTLSRLVIDWRIDVIFAPLALFLAVIYMLGVRRIRGYGQPWPAVRTAAWLAGCFVLLVATSSGLGRYAAAMFSMHMASHMLLSMLVPALLALGGPLTLARAALPPASERRLPGPRDWLDAVAASPSSRAVTHPVVALALFSGSPFVLYPTGMFDAAVRFHWAHSAIDAYFLIVGYAFLWPLIGSDPAPRPIPNLVRVGVLLSAMPADVVFGAVLMTTKRVIGNGVAASNMYQALALPWESDLHADQVLAGLLALIIGELALLLVLAVLVLRWSHDDDRDESGLRDYRAVLLDAESFRVRRR